MKKLDKALIIKMRRSGMSYKELSYKFEAKEDTIKKIIKRNAPDLLKGTVDKDKVIELFKKGMTYGKIAVEVDSNPEVIRKCVTKYAPEEVEKRRRVRKIKVKKLFEPNEDPLVLEQTGNLTVKERTEIMNSRSFGLNIGEGISERNFVIWNRQAYKTNVKNGKLYFNEKHGGSITKDVPPSYKQELLIVS